MISNYLAGETWLHRVPAGAKLASLAVLSVAILPVDDWRALVAALAGVVLLYASLGKEAFKRLAMIRSFAVFLAIIAVLHLLAGTWQEAVAAVARLVMMILLADLVSMTTTMQAMMAALTPVLTLLRPFGLNPRKLSLAVSLAIRFIPVLGANWQARSEAWRARTGRRPSFRLLGPFIADTFRMADHVAEALDARGIARSRRGGRGWG